MNKDKLPSDRRVFRHETGTLTAKQPKKKQTAFSKGTVWAAKITLITLVLAIAVSFVTQVTTSKTNIVISVLLLIFLIVIAIIFDAVGVATASCPLPPVLAMASRKVKGAAMAVKLLQNAGKVSNICNDVIGDMAGIISGTCAAAIVTKILAYNGNLNEYSMLVSILMSSLVSAVTVGGKAFFKNIAIKNAKEIMLFAGRVLSFFIPKKKNKQRKK